MAQLMQQRINGLDAVSLGELVTVGQVSDDGGLGLHLNVIFKPAAQLEEDIEDGEVGFAWGLVRSRPRSASETTPSAPTTRWSSIRIMMLAVMIRVWGCWCYSCASSASG